MRDHEVLLRLPANHVPLSPISFPMRSAHVHTDKIALVHDARRFTCRDRLARCRRFASALAAAGIAMGDTVAVLAPNIPERLEAHFGVPLAGAVLNTVNIRRDAPAVGFILRHAGAKLLLVDLEWGAAAPRRPRR